MEQGLTGKSLCSVCERDNCRKLQDSWIDDLHVSLSQMVSWFSEYKRSIVLEGGLSVNE